MSLESFLEGRRSTASKTPEYIFSLQMPLVINTNKYGLLTRRDHGREDLEKIVYGIVRLINTCVVNHSDTVFFLDVSARPVARIFHETWRSLFPIDVPPPHILFINIGRYQQDMEREFSDFVVDYLREAFGTFEGRSILIADEVSSGPTLDRAEDVLKTIAPSANRIDKIRVFDFVPKWYGEHCIIGVDDRKNGKGAEKYIVEVRRGTDKKELTKQKRFRSQLKKLGRLIASHAIKEPI